MKRFSRLASALLAPLLAGACMAEGPFPSLAQRDVERQPLGEPVRVMPLVPDDPALRGRIGDLVAQARQGDEAFEAAFGPAAAAARSAGQARTDSWIAAQEEVSRVVPARADLDRLALERSDLPTSVGDQAALDSAIAVVDRLAVDQQSRLDRLKALIAG